MAHQRVVGHIVRIIETLKYFRAVLLGQNLNKKNIVSDEISQSTKNGNKNTTHNYNYIMETVSEIYDTNEIPEVTFPITFKIIYQYKLKDPGQTAKLKLI